LTSINKALAVVLIYNNNNIIIIFIPQPDIGLNVILEDGVAYSVRWPLENRVFATVGRSLGMPYFVW
jgi:hypothetical protein